MLLFCPFSHIYFTNITHTHTHTHTHTITHTHTHNHTERLGSLKFSARTTKYLSDDAGAGNESDASEQSITGAATLGSTSSPQRTSRLFADDHDGDNEDDNDNDNDDDYENDYDNNNNGGGSNNNSGLDRINFGRLMGRGGNSSSTDPKAESAAKPTGAAAGRMQTMEEQQQEQTKQLD